MNHNKQGRAALLRARRFRSASGAVLTLCAAFGLVSCSKVEKSASSGAATNELLIVGYDREPDTMNRYATHILEDIQSCIVEGLVTNDETMQIVPVLAREIPTVENGGVILRADGGMDVIWKLRAGVKWHDGVPHTATDVQFTVNAINKGDWKPESVDGFDRITSVDTPDSLTAIVHYKEVYAPYRLQFVRGTLPEHTLRGRDLNSASDYNRAPLGTGPYKVTEWKTGEYIALERVADYWRGDGAPAIKRILFKFLPNTTTRINQLKSGEVHMVALVPWDKVRELRGVPALRLNQVVGNGYEHVSLNERHFQPFAELRVRQALAYAINRPLIVNTLLDSLVAIVNGPIQPLSPAYNPAVRVYDYHPEIARALLDSAGWKPGSDGVREKNGTRLSFTLITQSGFAIRENVAQTLQQQFREVGVEAKVQLVDGTSISSLWFNGEFDAMLHWWQQGADPEITLFFAADRAPPAGRNINYLVDSALTKLLYRSDRTAKESERIALLKEAQTRVSELAPEIPLYNTGKFDAVPRNLQDFKGNPTNAGPFWNVYAWKIVVP